MGDGHKHSVGKLALPSINLADEIAAQGFTWLNVTLYHAQAVLALHGHHRDPFDRLLITQAKYECMRMLTHAHKFGVTHPLAGPVSIGKITFSTIFFKIVFPITVPAWITKSIRIPVFDRVASVPNGSAPVTHQDQGPALLRCSRLSPLLAE